MRACVSVGQYMCVECGGKNRDVSHLLFFFKFRGPPGGLVNQDALRVRPRDRGTLRVMTGTPVGQCVCAFSATIQADAVLKLDIANFYNLDEYGMARTLFML